MRQRGSEISSRASSSSKSVYCGKYRCGYCNSIKRGNIVHLD